MTPGARRAECPDGPASGGMLGLHGDLHARCCLLPAELIDGVGQTFFAPAFPLEWFTICQALQVLDQKPPADQEGPAW